MVEYIRIPKERLSVLIGEKGEVKKQIENLTQTSIKIDEEGEVQVEKNKDALDPLAEWVARDIVKAIGRGFSPENAYYLAEEGMVLEIIDVTQFSGKSEDSLKRIKARLIGTEGKARKRIEDATETQISIYGKTISIIGRMENVQAAREAIIRLASGQMHTTVFRFLARRR